jgi:hypothetical protein
MSRTGRPPSITPEQEDEVIRLYRDEALTAREIQERTGITSQKIYTALRRRGVPRRIQRHGALNSRWKGGRDITSQGYVMLTISPDHPMISMADSRNRVLEHRLVMAEHLGRPLHVWETVHHKNSAQRQNNAVENLQLRVGKHGAGCVAICAECGSNEIIFDDIARDE